MWNVTFILLNIPLERQQSQSMIGQTIYQSTGNKAQPLDSLACPARGPHFWNTLKYISHDHPLCSGGFNYSDKTWRLYFPYKTRELMK